MTKQRRVFLSVALGGVLTLAGVLLPTRREAASPPRGQEVSAAASPVCPGGLPPLGYELPSLLNTTTQPGADCFAWQDFVALNWPASSQRGQPDRDASVDAFGEPGTEGNFPAVVWQTYMNTAEVFLPDAVKPPDWNSEPPPASCSPPSSAPPRLGSRPPHTQAFVRAVSNLSQVEKFTPSAALQPSEVPQRAGFTWLADTDSNLVWYEIKINEPEYDFIVDAGVYNAANQWALSQAGKSGVKSPTGAIHIKAAWRRITDPADYTRYLMTDACIPTPGGGSEWAQLGLVGLHIVHKPQNQVQWVWATFEHVDNAPTVGHLPDAGSQYSFYDPSCTPTPIPASCLPPDAGPAWRSCDGGEPAYTLAAYFDGGADECGPYPIQVVRETPLPSGGGADDSPVQQVNAAMQQQIRAANPNSVFQNYQLVNVMWWNSPFVNSMTGGAAVPLPQEALAPPPGYPVANTVLETYVQKSRCLDCHAYGAVSTAGGRGGACESDGGLCAADFAFIFARAQLPADAGTE